MPRRSLRSAPAENARSPAPVMAMRRARGSAAAARAAASRSVSSSPLSAFIASGRSSTTQATPLSATSSLTVVMTLPRLSRRLADVRLQVPRRQLVADRGGERVRAGDELVEVHAGLDAHGVEARDQILGRQVPGRAGGVGAAAEAADGGVERGDAHGQTDEAVGERGAAGV